MTQTVSLKDLAAALLSYHFLADAVQAFRALAAERDIDLQLLGEDMIMVFQRFGSAKRIVVIGGRRERI